MPVEGIGGAKKGHLRRAEGPRQVHRRGIDRQDQRRRFRQRRQGEEIEPPAQVARREARAGCLDLRKVALLVPIRAAREHAGQAEVLPRTTG